jgi:hypothetical protein
MESEHADAAAPVDVYHVGEGRCLVWDAPGACSLYYDYLFFCYFIIFYFIC